MPAPYIAVIVMARLERPWEALKLPLFVSRQSQDTLISSTDMGLVGEVLFADLDHYLAVIRAARPVQFDVDAVCGALAGFAELSMGLVKEVEMRRDGKWGQRLMKSRATVAEALEVFMEQAPREIFAALPTHRASYQGRAHLAGSGQGARSRKTRTRARLCASGGGLPALRPGRLLRRSAQECERRNPHRPQPLQ